MYIKLWHKNNISLAVEFDNAVGKYDVIKIFGSKKEDRKYDRERFTQLL